MVRALDWTEDEFQTLITGYRLSDAELMSRLPNRTMGAINVVREGVHACHIGSNTSMLSQMMLSYLNRNQSTLECPKCGAKFQ